jgi:choline dehydrogenase-like flavoprotein
MLVDASNRDCRLSGATRFAVVGAGPVGMTIARELSNSGPVLLFESGGLAPSAQVRSLSRGESIGWPYSLTDSRARGLGGTSSLWAGWCAIFDPIDFARRDWVENSGWPISIGDIEPYYERAAEVLNLDGAEFDAVRLVAGAADLPFDKALVRTSVWRFGSPTVRFADKFHAEFASSAALTTLLHASVVDLRLDRDHGRVVEIVVRTIDGREGRVAADVVVLAGGGIENARLLLNADTQCRAGIGNARGWVGRCFMEHPHEAVDGVELADAAWFRYSLRPASLDDRHPFMLAFGLTPEAQRGARVLNARAHVYRTADMRDDEAPRLGLFLEQSPNPRSRIGLADSTDDLGLRRARLDWQFDALDRETHARTGRLLTDELVRCGVAKHRVVAASDRRALIPTNHHIGTTRMSASDDEGVVDVHCRVHGIENLFVAGSSVFPTSSWANPTFTSIALSLRLADRLRETGTASKGAGDHG